MSTLTVTLTDVDGEPMLDSEAMALLFGVRTEDVRALPTVNGVSTIPANGSNVAANAPARLWRTPEATSSSTACATGHAVITTPNSR